MDVKMVVKDKNNINKHNSAVVVYETRCLER